MLTICQNEGLSILIFGSTLIDTLQWADVQSPVAVHAARGRPGPKPGVILHFNHISRGRNAKSFGEPTGLAASALTTLAEGGAIDPKLLRALRVHLDGIHYRTNFRERVMVRQTTMPAGEAGPLAEIANELPHEIVALEIGGRWGLRAKAWLDGFESLDEQSGTGFYPKLTFVLGDYSKATLDRALMARASLTRGRSCTRAATSRCRTSMNKRLDRRRRSGPGRPNCVLTVNGRGRMLRPATR